MTEPNIIYESFATGEEIKPIVAKLETLLGDVSRPHALIALTSVILMIQYPDITPEQIYEGVKDVSRFICMWSAGTASEQGLPLEPLATNQIN